MKVLSVNEKPKLKLKKNAMEFVNFEEEKKHDPKYKTELCKSWSETGFCVYGNKCRFAHGRHELSSKPIDTCKYKMKECNSFKELGFCMYGTRCNFKHDERKMDILHRSYYYFKLLATEEGESCLANCYQTVVPNKRLEVFEKLGGSSKQDSLNSSTSSSSQYPKISPTVFHLNNLGQKMFFPQSFQPIYARLS
jgi:hypothetical protein